MSHNLKDTVMTYMFSEHPVHPDYSILSTKYQPTIFSLVKFELISVWGRIFQNKKPKSKFNKNYLHLGCGDVLIDNWINADFFKIKFWKKNRPDWVLDLRYNLNCKDDFWDGVYTEHTLEHLTPYHNLKLFKELFRTMKSGACLRICVPGLDQSLAPYLDKNNNSTEYLEFRKFYPNLASSIWGLTQNWVHLSVWNGELMKIFLEEVGFINVSEVSFGNGSNSDVIKDSEHRRIGSLYMEAFKK